MNEDERSRWSGRGRVPEPHARVDWFTTPMSGCVLLLSLLWLGVVGVGVVFVLIFSDDQSPEALAFYQRTFWLGALLGPAPLVTLIVVLVRQRLSQRSLRRLPPPQAEELPQAGVPPPEVAAGLSVRQRTLGALALIALGLVVTDRLLPSTIHVGDDTAIAESAVVVADGPDHLTRLSSNGREQTYDLRGYDNVDLPVHLLLPFYLRAGDRISKDARHDELRVGRDGHWSEWHDTGPKF